MKMNKKGFTLIEMLVVIAIIAVLVAIIIPTVTSATNKAACATNAANLRSVKAEVVTAMLTNDTTNYDITKTGGKVTAIAAKSTHALPTSKATSTPSCDADLAPTITVAADGVTVTVTYGSNKIQDFANGAS